MPSNIPGISAGVGAVAGVALDAGGNVFFISSDYSVLFRLDAKTGTVTVVAGNGSAGFSGDGGPATSAQLNQPQGIAVDSAGNIFIADYGNFRIREVSNGLITTVAGTGTGGYSGDNGPATSAEMDSPSFIAVDSAGNFYFPDGGLGVVRKVSNGVITTVAGNGANGFGGDGGPATSAQLCNPSGLAIDPAGNLYIGDRGNSRIREVSNGEITTIAGTNLPGFSGDNGPAMSAQLFDILDIALDPSGNLFLDDNNRIREISNGIISTVAGTGAYSFSGDGGASTSAALSNPFGIAVDSAGNIFIADEQNERIREVSAGTINTIAGNGTGFAGDDGPASAAQFDHPSSVAVDSSGNLFIGDKGNARVRKVAAGVVTTVAGNGSGTYAVGNGSPMSVGIGGPIGIGLDASGNLYMESLSHVSKLSASAITTVAGNGSSGYFGDGGPATTAAWESSAGLAVDPLGNFYIADNQADAIRKVSGGIITTLAGMRGEEGYFGDGVPATQTGLSYPSGVAADSQGNVFIADRSNSRIREVTPNGIISTVAGNGGICLPGDGGAATNAHLGFPTGIAVDPSGSLYFVDVGVIRKVAGGIISTIAGGGTAQGDGGPATAAQFSNPVALAVDAAGNVYVADSGSNSIRLLTPSGSACAYTVTSSGLNPSFSGGSVTATIQTSASCPWAIQNLPDWITMTGSALGSGPSTIALAVAPDSGSSRSAQISIAGVSLGVTQLSGQVLVGSGAVVNAASYTAPVAPGSITAAFGNFLLNAPTAAAFPIPTNLGGLSLQFGNSFLAPIFFADYGQANAQVPWELAGQSQATITASINGQTSAPQTVNIATYAPGIFSVNGAGTGAGAILDNNYQLVSSTNPTTAGAYIQIYCTGLGPVTNQPATGAPSPSDPVAQTTTLPMVTIGISRATVQFAGLTPGTVGLYQINAQVPDDVVTGSAVSLSITINGVESNTVTIAVQ